jgi:hypothetical protein
VLRLSIWPAGALLLIAAPLRWLDAGVLVPAAAIGLAHLLLWRGLRRLLSDTSKSSL